jgi:hypothetical protein
LALTFVCRELRAEMSFGEQSALLIVYERPRGKRYDKFAL